METCLFSSFTDSDVIQALLLTRSLVTGDHDPTPPLSVVVTTALQVNGRMAVMCGSSSLWRRCLARLRSEHSSLRLLCSSFPIPRRLGLHRNSSALASSQFTLMAQERRMVGGGLSSCTGVVEPRLMLRTATILRPDCAPGDGPHLS